MEVRSKKKPQQPVQPTEDKRQTATPQPASEFESEEEHEPEHAEQSLVQLLQTLRDIHEGACIVTLLVTDNVITVQSTQKVIVNQGEQK